jgi:hypothetical protein
MVNTPRQKGKAVQKQLTIARGCFKTIIMVKTIDHYFKNNGQNNYQFDRGAAMQPESHRGTRRVGRGRLGQVLVIIMII